MGPNICLLCNKRAGSQMIICEQEGFYLHTQKTKNVPKPVKKIHLESTEIYVYQDLIKRSEWWAFGVERKEREIKEEE